MTWQVQMALGDADMVYVYAPYQLKDMCKSLPGRKPIYDGGKFVAWAVALPQLNDAVQHFRQVVSCQVLLDRKLADRYEDVVRRKQRAVEVKSRTEAVDLDLRLMNNPELLYPYQPLGGEFLRTTENGILAMDMGTGKSVTAMTAATDLFLQEAGFKPGLGPVGVLGGIIVPPKTLVYNWLKEIRKWTPFDAIVADGTPKKRRKAYEAFRDGDCPFIILNYELCKFDYNVIQEVLGPMVRHCIVIADEAHRLKNRQTSTVECFKGGNKPGSREGLFRHARYRWALTGTPLENRIEELWAIVDWVSPGLLGKFSVFMEQFTIKDLMGSVMGVQNLSLLREKIDPVMFRKTKEEALPDLPPLVELPPYYVEMGEKQKKVYEQVESGTLIYEDEHGNQEETVLEMLAQFTRLQQVCDTPMLIPGCDILDSAKIDELLKIIGDFCTDGKLRRKVLVFSQYKTMCDILIQPAVLGDHNPLYIHGGVPTAHSAMALRRMRAYLEQNGMHPVEAGKTHQHWQAAEACGVSLTRQEIAAKFNESDSNLIVVDTAAKEGLDIYFEYGIMFDELFNPQAMRQIFGRGHRLGTTFKTVFIIHLITKGSYEERKQEMLESKKALFSSVIDGIDSGGVAISDEKLITKLTKDDLMYLLGR